jgi:hypothetical protein
MPRHDIHKSFTYEQDNGREEFTAKRIATVWFYFLSISEKCSLMMAASYSRNM